MNAQHVKKSSSKICAVASVFWLIPTISLLAQEVTESRYPATAWQLLLEKNPRSVVDLAPSAIEQKVLQALTDEQLFRYAEGAEPETILLPSGENLAEFITRVEATTEAGLVYKPLTAPCTILDTRKTGRRIEADESRTLRLRGTDTDYSEYGGDAEGCGIPSLQGEHLKRNTARALFLNIHVFDADGSGELNLWPAGDFEEPSVSLLTYSETPSLNGFMNSVTVTMCDEESLDPCPGGDLSLSARDAGTHLAISLLGVFESAISHARTQVETAEQQKSMTSPYWEQMGTSIFYNDGNVGIGTDLPGEKLDILAGALRLTTTDGTTPGHWSLIRNQNTGRLVFRSLTTATGLETFPLKINPAARSSSLIIGDSSTEGATRVGIGALVPAAELHVSGGSASAEILIEADSSNSANENLHPKISLSQDGGLVTGELGYFSGTDNLRLINKAGGAAITLSQNGNIGVGLEAQSQNPQEALEVGGTILSSRGGFRFPDGSLQSTASLADGHSLDAIGGGITDALLVNAAGDVGVGTQLPEANLHLSGPNGPVELLIEADPANLNETFQPKLTLSQDGGLVTGQIGYFNGTNDLRVTNSSAGTSVVLRSNGDICIGSGC